MLGLGELAELERQLRASIVALNQSSVGSVTLLEAVDAIGLWPASFEAMLPLAPQFDLDRLLERVPLVVCAAAAEIGFRFEGVGTEFWAKFEKAMGSGISVAQRTRIGEEFRRLAIKYELAQPSESAFSAHFSNISWPIAHALLPIDLVGAVGRLLARSPIQALPATGRNARFESLRAWAGSMEGARLVDWLRLEGPTGRVLRALLTENRPAVLPEGSYHRVQSAIAGSAEASQATRAARRRLAARGATPVPLVAESPGRLTASRGVAGIALYISWPALPPALVETAGVTARAAHWRPRLWGIGSGLHPVDALGPGPFAIALQSVPPDGTPAYPEIGETFGAGSDTAALLAARTFAWEPTLVFEPDSERIHAEQRFDILSGSEGIVWIATRPGGANVAGLRRVGSGCGYAFVEADLADPGHRAVLVREGLLSAERRFLLARHPFDAIGASQGVVRPGRPFLLFRPGEDEEAVPRTLNKGERFPGGPGAGGEKRLRDPAGLPVTDIVDILLFDRDTAFEALCEGRLQFRVESRLPLVDVTVTAEVEIAGHIVARGRERFAALPASVVGKSALLAPLYSDRVRARLLEAGTGILRLSIGRSLTVRLALQRPPASVDWGKETPTLLGADLHAELVMATARYPHRFAPAVVIGPPDRGAVAFALKLGDGRIADPIQILATDRFELGDLATHFGDDLGSRRMSDGGRGVGEIGRARIAWARALCRSLPSIAVRSRIVGQFEEPLVVALCGQSWFLAERTTRRHPRDPHLALWQVVLDRGMAEVPEGCPMEHQELFASAFRRHALRLDPDWPMADEVPRDGSMDDALNEAFTETIEFLHGQGVLRNIEADEHDFGHPHEDWEQAAGEALRQIGRPPLVRLLAPAAGGKVLSQRSYQGASVAELAEDLAAWTKQWALPRGQLTPETAATALQFWRWPAACGEIDAVLRVLAVDPFVSRATRYAALRLDGGMDDGLA